MSAIQRGYIHNARSDLLWFVALPVIAIAIAYVFHTQLPYIAQASITVWITVPHHYAGWVRGYGLSEDWDRWRGRLIIGPLILIPTLVFGTAYLPITVALVMMLWDHQHSLMQQYGFSRIYDFKAGSGTPGVARMDLWLSVALYVNMLITAPLWAELWIAELYRWDLALSAGSINQLQTLSWSITLAYLGFYAVQIRSGVAQGHAVNPMKYWFLLSSYGLWYYVSWQDSLILYLVAHRIMHGVQYMLMVYWYVDNKAERTGATPRLLGRLNVQRFILFGALYAIAFHIGTGGGISVMSFGLIDALQQDAILQYSAEKATAFYSTLR